MDSNAEEDDYFLEWEKHHSAFVSFFSGLFRKSLLVDCTLAAEEKYIKAHRIVLMACSPYFEELLSDHCDNFPIVFLNIKFTELQSIIDFCYRGQVRVSPEDLDGFLTAANMLRIRGLSDGAKHFKSFERPVTLKSVNHNKRRKSLVNGVSEGVTGGLSEGVASGIGVSDGVISDVRETVTSGVSDVDTQPERSETSEEDETEVQEKKQKLMTPELLESLVKDLQSSEETQETSVTLVGLYIIIEILTEGVAGNAKENHESGKLGPNETFIRTTSMKNPKVQASLNSLTSEKCLRLSGNTLISKISETRTPVSNSSLESLLQLGFKNKTPINDKAVSPHKKSLVLSRVENIPKTEFEDNSTIKLMKSKPISSSELKSANLSKLFGLTPKSDSTIMAPPPPPPYPRSKSNSITLTSKPKPFGSLDLHSKSKIITTEGKIKESTTLKDIDILSLMTTLDTNPIETQPQTDSLDTSGPQPKVMSKSHIIMRGNLIKK